MHQQPDESHVRAVLERDRILPVVVLDDPGAAGALGEAISGAGLSAIEVMLRTPAAIQAIADLANGANLVVGAGTVCTRDDAARAIDAGASFVVSPGVSVAVVRYCRDVGVPVIPGVATATDILTALELGCDMVKFFPADINGGLPAIKALSAPFPMVRFVPTGGISATTLGSYLTHPAVLAVGGTWLAPRALIAASDWTSIASLVARAITIRNESKPADA